MPASGDIETSWGEIILEKDLTVAYTEFDSRARRWLSRGHRMLRKILVTLGLLSSSATQSSIVTDEEISKNYEAISKVSTIFLKSFGPQFTNTPEGHIQTDIAGASVIAGLLLLRETVPNLDKAEPGIVIISPVHEGQQRLLDFMQRISHGMNLNSGTGWTNPIDDKYRPLKDVPILAKELEKPFVRACKSVQLDPKFWPYAAALTSMKLIFAGTQMKILDEGVGKSLAVFYMVAGSKTVPAR